MDKRTILSYMLWLQCMMASVSGFLLGTLTFSTMKSFVFDGYIVGESMSPTLEDEECILGLELSHVKADIGRGDIISFHPPFDTEEELYTKRVIGLPGESVSIEDGKIYINGSDVPLYEPYLEYGWTVDAGPYHFQVPDGHYLVMGDNRDESYDSRGWENPYVGYEDIRSKIYFVKRPWLNFLY